MQPSGAAPRGASSLISHPPWDFRTDGVTAMDAVLLSRIQFAWTIMFHYLFPPLSIGLGLALVFMEWMYIRTGDPRYEAMTRFWARIFGLSFAMGVASGIVMEFQFGTNWSNYSRFVGDVFGSVLAAEGIFAFFLESGFLAIVLFGWDRVSRRVHFFATCMVALGSVFSAIWIVVANSWQQTPAGFHLVERAGMIRAEVTDFAQVVFNPSSMMRLAHVLLGAWILGAFFVMSITAFYILKRRHVIFARRGFVIGLLLAVISSSLQLVTGHFSGQIVAKHQPPKLAAFEGLFQTQARAPIHLFGIPNLKTRQVDYSIAIPGALSFLATNDFKATVTGLDKVPEKDWPPIVIPFISFHVMVGLGCFFIGITWLAVLLLWGGRLFEQRWLLWIFVFAVVGPFITNEAGWVATEVGRQPWNVYGMLRTAQSASPTVKSGEILTSLILFSLVYIALFLIFIYVLDRKIREGPEDIVEMAEETGPTDLLDVIARRGKTAYGQLEK